MSRTYTLISYAREDAAVVLRLVRRLRAAGARLWLDKLDIAPGEQWDVALERALAGCDCVVVLLTKTSVASESVRDELAYALDKRKRVIPVLLEDCEIPLRLRRRQRIDLTNDPSEGFTELARALGAQTGEAGGVGEARKPGRSKSKVFVSCDYAYDRHYANLLAKWDATREFNFQLVRETIDAPVDSDDATATCRALGRRINGATHVLCLIGRLTHKNEWVDWEIKKAIELGKPLVAVKIAKRYQSPPALMGAGARWAMSLKFRSIQAAIHDA